ncbi:type II and III secretion system protein family protein [Sphingomonas donggukensis]|uniref:Type II and III secretion system protein family protein n=1 Tax=Sphingomonas donggukensis TaxID=2949093 RepID=A0ABY4TUA2_9SPHN|nr:type II and III secretion system protein family protein [Sphingomonas donggukensis]URW75983.1 type II and III secretion system protein family protein [Sphingomonas donggukensis]
MRSQGFIRRSLAASAAAALTLNAAVPAVAGPGGGQRVRVGQPAGTQRPTSEVLLSVGQGQLVNLPADVTTVWTSNPGVADVYVSSSRQINVFGKDFGEATIFATSASGAVVYSTNVRVSQNLTSIDRMMKLAMPDADIRVTTVGQLAVITGTVASPTDSQEAQRLVTMLLNPGIDISGSAPLKIGVVNRLRTATPLQVNLQVKFAEVSRSFIKNIGVNLQTRDLTDGFQLNVASGRSVGSIGSASTAGFPLLDASARYGLPTGSISLPFNPATGDFVLPNTGTAFDFSKLAGTERTAIGLATKLAGLDILSAIDLGETVGQVTTLANPNLTALSGETGTFLAGGEIPIPVSQGLGAVSVEYKQYGVSLAYTPTVLSDGRISLRVRPEVSQLSAAGAVTIGGTSIPALTTRRAETTVELGSGQSFMIAGLMQNSHDNQFSKTPGISDIPVLGALFRSNGFKRNETELVIVITPYLVKPVNAADVVLPTDGYKAPTDLSRVLLGTLASGKSGGDRPKPQMAQPSAPPPSIGVVTPAPVLPARAPQDDRSVVGTLPAATPTPRKGKDKKDAGGAMPGFSFK